MASATSLREMQQCRLRLPLGRIVMGSFVIIPIHHAFFSATTHSFTFFIGSNSRALFFRVVWMAITLSCEHSFYEEEAILVIVRGLLQNEDLASYYDVEARSFPDFRKTRSWITAGGDKTPHNSITNHQMKKIFADSFSAHSKVQRERLKFFGEGPL